MNSQYTLSDPYTITIKVDKHTKYSIGITVRFFFPTDERKKMNQNPHNFKEIEPRTELQSALRINITLSYIGLKTKIVVSMNGILYCFN